MKIFCARILGVILFFYGSAVAQTGTALIRHAPVLNGHVEGSVRQFTAESTTLNGGAEVTGDLLVPGMPTVRLNGNPIYGGTLEGTGAATPTSHIITINGNAKLGHVLRRTDAGTLAAVAAPLAPTGTRTVSLNNANQAAGDFATLKNLTLNSGAGTVVVPPGAYGAFTANGNGGFILGVAGATTPAVYHFQSLMLNGNASLQVVGPVIVTLAGAVAANGDLGSPDHPEWLTLRFATGGLTLNGNVSVYASLQAPSGRLIVNGNTEFIGRVEADALTVNGNGLLRLLETAAPNQPPTVALTAPVNGTTLTAPATFTLNATAADADGTVTVVEFFQGATKLGEDNNAPYTLTVNALAAGTYVYTARAFDNLGASNTSVGSTITVATPANQPPTVALTAPIDGATFIAPANVLLTATATDVDGAIARVEFYQGATKLGEAVAAPYAWTVTGLAAGSYVFSAHAVDNVGAVATSAASTITVNVPANLSPTVSLTAPTEGATFTAPAALALAANAADADGAVTRVEFFQNGVKLGEDVAAPYTWTVSGLTPGSYAFTARATDNQDAIANSSVVNVTVNAPVNQPPLIELMAPAANASYTAPATISISASASDLDGTISKVEFFNGPTKLGEDLVAPYEYMWAGVTKGSYTLTAVATDSSGATATSSARLIAVVVDHGVPFLAGFEPAEGYQLGPLHGQNDWVVLGSAEVVATPVASGQQALSVAPATTISLVGRLFTNTDPRVTFVDLYAQPASTAAPADGVFLETDVARVALTKNGSQGVLQAFNGDGTSGGGTWISAATGPTLDAAGHTTDWMRLTARADYATKHWDLYYNGQMIAADLGFFAPTTAAFTSLGLSGHATLTTGFDDVLVAFDNPLFIDVDHDGMEDAWEIAHGLNPTLNDRDADLDGDGLTNIREYLLGTNPNAIDTDGDGLSDSQELTVGTSPANADSDGDGLPDGWEKSHALNPLSPADATLDTDGDGVTNLAEYQAGTDPADYFNGVEPQVTALIGPNGELGQNDSLTIVLTNAAGNPLANAPITAAPLTGGHKLSLTPGGPSEDELTVRTDASGRITVYVRPAN